MTDPHGGESTAFDEDTIPIDADDPSVGQDPTLQEAIGTMEHATKPSHRLRKQLDTHFKHQQGTYVNLKA